MHGCISCAVPDDRKYAESHEWCKNDGGVSTVGITDFAQVRKIINDALSMSKEHFIVLCISISTTFGLRCVSTTEWYLSYDSSSSSPSPILQYCLLIDVWTSHVEVQHLAIDTVSVIVISYDSKLPTRFRIATRNQLRIRTVHELSQSSLEASVLWSFSVRMCVFTGDLSVTIFLQTHFQNVI